MTHAFSIGRISWKMSRTDLKEEKRRASIAFIFKLPLKMILSLGVLCTLLSDGPFSISPVPFRSCSTGAFNSPDLKSLVHF